ncbi:hypothetical protein SKAU_G00144970 [Synaphobranchus kaupii]|uniref:Uncharacterized protein n=1 Tax=Synaphobranchus kaupii TaxID=118154 RepID=A0A9Q1FSW1_SYNKA|nr:hypothetical protein SKAU_G00144970 [Synaphobranchus kaupii]
MPTAPGSTDWLRSRAPLASCSGGARQRAGPLQRRSPQTGRARRGGVGDRPPSAFHVRSPGRRRARDTAEQGRRTAAAFPRLQTGGCLRDQKHIPDSDEKPGKLGARAADLLRECQDSTQTVCNNNNRGKRKKEQGCLLSLHREHLFSPALVPAGLPRSRPRKASGFIFQPNTRNSSQ